MYIYCKELAHVILEAEKFHNQPSVTWQSTKAGHVIQLEYNGLRTRADGVNPSAKAEKQKMRYPSPSRKADRKKGQIPPSAFCSIPAPNKLNNILPCQGEQSALLSPLIQMLISSGYTLIDTPRNKV